jgi:hypothetical protein
MDGGGDTHADKKSIKKTATSDFNLRQKVIGHPLKICLLDNATKQFIRSTIIPTCINNHQFDSTLASYFRMMRGLCLPNGRFTWQTYRLIFNSGRATFDFYCKYHHAIWRCAFV